MPVSVRKSKLKGVIMLRKVYEQPTFSMQTFLEADVLTASENEVNDFKIIGDVFE